MEESADPLSVAIVLIVVPDDMNETDNVLQLWSNVAWLEPCKLLTWFLQYGQELHVYFGLLGVILDNKHTKDR